ncbi:Maf family protein [Microvirga thermotolerans]|uniref:Nucleoside triphosphate pyrophosphatase n=1 Tax=Microvirga thermotolerans TaxID=2651334 RepID=A0A5P9JRH4_9HYPH|nr:nucleoside triphosphate pyrophosphatase [Microvirga thermotolerans]QFU14963.1 septum formation inhibitor Maf [Microvirga thermotolerans]
MASPWIADQPLLLASTSRTRLTILVGAGLPVETQSPGVDERAVEAAARAEALAPPQLARRLAAEKALAVSRRHPGRLVLGADQVLDCEGTVLHKPSGREAAKEHLSRLSGRTHALHSAVALARDGAVTESFVDSACLTMRPLDGPALDRYLDLAGPEAFLSVGAYRLEGLGIHLFEKVEGDHFTILGLPLIPLLAVLRRGGYLSF